MADELSDPFDRSGFSLVEQIASGTWEVQAAVMSGCSGHD